jgi:hypothetical protein
VDVLGDAQAAAVTARKIRATSFLQVFMIFLLLLYLILPVTAPILCARQSPY